MNVQTKKQIRDFLNEHGMEGFLRLYIREYLMELLLNEVKSAGENSEVDSGVQMVFGDGPPSNDELDEFEEELREEADSRAQKLVTRLKENESVGSAIQRGDLDIIEEEVFEKELKNEFHDLIQEWSENEE